jgi:hypothetical protein
LAGWQTPIFLNLSLCPYFGWVGTKFWPGVLYSNGKIITKSLDLSVWMSFWPGAKWQIFFLAKCATQSEGPMKNTAVIIYCCNHIKVSKSKKSVN